MLLFPSNVQGARWHQRSLFNRYVLFRIGFGNNVVSCHLSLNLMSPYRYRQAMSGWVSELYRPLLAPGRDAGGGGSGGSCPPNFETVGGTAPQFSSVNLLYFHYSYKCYKDVLCRRQPATAKHIILLSGADYFWQAWLFQSYNAGFINLVAAQWYQVT